MDVLEAIFTRRSVRKYTEQPVDEEALKLILNAGFSAPSAHNYQPWHFVVIKEKSIRESISEFHPYAKMLPQAGCCIIVCGDKEKQGMTGFLVADCSAAIENMLLAAHGLGLGAVWCGLYPVPQLTRPIKKLLNLPASIVPVGMVVLGNTEKKGKTVERYDESKIHFEQW